MRPPLGGSGAAGSGSDAIPAWLSPRRVLHTVAWMDFMHSAVSYLAHKRSCLPTRGRQQQLSQGFDVWAIDTVCIVWQPYVSADRR